MDKEFRTNANEVMNLKEEVSAHIVQTRHNLLELMAGAYCNLTKIPPHEAVLVEKHSGNDIMWFFERKEVKDDGTRKNSEKELQRKEEGRAEEEKEEDRGRSREEGDIQAP